MGMVTHAINRSFPATSTDAGVLFALAKELVTQNIIPILEQYNNVSYMGMYENGTQAKYVFDVGYEHLALCVFVNGGGVSICTCKKSDTNNLNYLEGNASTINVGSYGNKTWTVNLHLRIIEHNNDVKVFFSTVNSSTVATYKFMLDVDNLGNKYIANTTAYTNALNMYHDNDEYVKKTASFQTINNSLDMQVLMSKVVFLHGSSFSCVSTDIVDIKNLAIDSTSTHLTMIDVEGIKYRKISGCIWYRED